MHFLGLVPLYNLDLFKVTLYFVLWASSPSSYHLGEYFCYFFQASQEQIQDKHVLKMFVAVYSMYSRVFFSRSNAQLSKISEVSMGDGGVRRHSDDAMPFL